LNLLKRNLWLLEPLNTPLFESVKEKKRVWKAEKIIDITHLRMTNSWYLISRLKIPPKVKKTALEDLL
jgi:hypothetical protein